MNWRPGSISGGYLRSTNPTWQTVLLWPESFGLISFFLKRGDQRRIYVELIAGIVFWFHPFMYWLRQRLARTREEVCDNYVLSTLAAEDYSEVLLRLSRQSSKGRRLIPALGMFDVRWRLEERIAGLLDSRRGRMVRVSRLMWLSVVCGFVLVGVGFAVAQPPGSGASPVASAVNQGTVSSVRDDEVVATVNGSHIRRSEVNDYLAERYGDEALSAIRNRRIIELECKKKGVEVNEDEIDREIHLTAQKFGLTRDKWLKTIQIERNLSDKTYRRDVVWPMLALRKLAGTDDSKALSGYFDTNRKKSSLETLQKDRDTQDRQSYTSTAHRKRIAFVNVARVFEKSERFKLARESLKARMNQVQSELKASQFEVAKLTEVLKAVSNDDARKQLQELIDAKRAKLVSLTQQARASVLKDESKLYYGVYREMRREVAAYARENNIDLVLRAPSSGSANSLRDAFRSNTQPPVSSQDVISA